MMKKLQTGKHYWFRDKKEQIWRIVYVGNDPDNAQWLHFIGSPALEVSRMKLGCFEWKEIPKPEPTPDECIQYYREQISKALGVPLNMLALPKPTKRSLA